MVDNRTKTTADIMLEQMAGFDIESEIKAQDGLTVESVINMAYNDITNYIIQNNEYIYSKADVELTLTAFVDEFGVPYRWYRKGAYLKIIDCLDEFTESPELTEEAKNDFMYAQGSLIISYFLGLKEGIYSGAERHIPINNEVYKILKEQLQFLYLSGTAFKDEL